MFYEKIVISKRRRSFRDSVVLKRGNPVSAFIVVLQ